MEQLATEMAIADLVRILDPLLTNPVVAKSAMGQGLVLSANASSKKKKLVEICQAMMGMTRLARERFMSPLLAEAKSKHKERNGPKFTAATLRELVAALEALDVPSKEYRLWLERDPEFNSPPMPSAVATPVPASSPASEAQQSDRPMTKADPGKVFIIHGRNHEAVKEMGIFLRFAGLQALPFRDVRASLKGTPSVADVVMKGMTEALGIIALVTPDEFSTLRPEHRTEKDKKKPGMIDRWQARPNVIFEAGMAFGMDRDRVVFVLLGEAELWTDVEGIHVLRPDNQPRGDRETLFKTLKGMGCTVGDSLDWQTHGDFVKCVLPPTSTQDPFVAG